MSSWNVVFFHVRNIDRLLCWICWFPNFYVEFMCALWLVDWVLIGYFEFVCFRVTFLNIYFSLVDIVWFISCVNLVHKILCCFSSFLPCRSLSISITVETMARMKTFCQKLTYLLNQYFRQFQLWLSIQK